MRRAGQLLTSFALAAGVLLVALLVARPQSLSEATVDPRVIAALPTPTVEVPKVIAPVPEAPTPTPTPAPTPSPTPRPSGWVDPKSFGKPWSETVSGVLTFRGNPTRSYHGEGPVPENPEVRWRYPDRAMCSLSTVGEETKQWCGLGWTGQPAVWERDDELWVAFGAYDGQVHFINGDDGTARLPPFRTGDIIKGSVTVDPDGFPLLYAGSRDNQLRIIAFDGPAPVELWALDARSISPRRWNDDWDGSPLVIDDYLFEGGENSNFHIVKLNRSYGDDGRVAVAPELVAAVPGWDAELTALVGSNVSIETSVVISGQTAWFANSGGLIQGWDLSGLDAGAPPERIFRYWAGDDIDATMVADDEGFLYVGVEYERGNERSREVGQILKLDPGADDPLVWSVADHSRRDAGVWATPAVHDDVVFASTDTGRLLGIDRETGEIRWEKQLGLPLWSSQVVIDDTLLQADCFGVIHAYDISDTTVEPPELWQTDVGDGCIEATPVVWKGRIYVGSRGGRFAMLDEAATSES